VKVLIYMPFAAWTPHFETDLELAARHLAAGDDVHVVPCAGALAYCDPNPSYSPVYFAYCRMRRAGAAQGWKSYIRGQERGLLPSGWDPGKRNIVVFNSSQDEFETFAEMRNPVYADQSEALDALAAASLPPDVRLYLRVHPNLARIYNSQLQHLARMRAPRLTTVDATSPVDTYALLGAAEKVLTFGSTVGVEATFWGKPSILVGRSLYEHLGACAIPRSHEELLAMLAGQIQPGSRAGALAYGFWNATAGIAHDRFDSLGRIRGRFDGRVLRGSRVLFGAAMAQRLVDKAGDLVRRLAFRATW
jgi:hypothetical protein